MKLQAIKRFLLGNPLDPFAKNTRSHIALVTFFAWVGLGADGISSSAYGPEQAFMALGTHTQLAVFLAFATGITVFLISAAYLQVIELFPQGGGGYKVASKLIGPHAGLVAGSALIIDYVLTIAISIASAVDSLLSAMPMEYHLYAMPAKYALVLLLIYLNLRGVKESIKVLMPIFLGFIITHVGLIVYGILSHASDLDMIIPDAVYETKFTAKELGWFAMLVLFFKAFSLGGGTYTGLEAVSNSMQNMAEPRVRTGKSTMICIAASLAFMATGIILVYLLWDVIAIPGQTMNATAFAKITADWSVGDVNISSYVVLTAMLFTAGLLFVAANTGFIAGPAVLANMAADRWMPHLFTALSSRLVTKNGILLMGIAAIIALFITRGKVHLLVVLYSINVFLTFTLSLTGLCRHHWQTKKGFVFVRGVLIPALALLVCASVLIVTVLEKFVDGAWITVLITGLVVAAGQATRLHYLKVFKKLHRREREVEKMLGASSKKVDKAPVLDPAKPTAVFIIGEMDATGMSMFTWVQKNFAGIFRNFIFVSVGEIDTEELADLDKLQNLRRNNKRTLKQYVNFCQSRGLASGFYHAYGTDVIEKLTELTDTISREYADVMFFSTKLISDNDSFLTQILHNETAYIMQRRLHNRGKTQIIIPLKL